MRLILKILSFKNLAVFSYFITLSFFAYLFFKIGSHDEQGILCAIINFFVWAGVASYIEKIETESYDLCVQIKFLKDLMGKAQIYKGE